MSSSSAQKNRELDIESACEQLLRAGKPITRKNIAELVGCHPRTVSSYKNAWKKYLPQAGQVLSGPVEYRDRSIRESVDRIQQRIDQTSSPAELRSLLTAIVWFEELPQTDEERRLIARTKESLTSRL